jgi:hypothetical protein
VAGSSNSHIISSKHCVLNLRFCAAAMAKTNAQKISSTTVTKKLTVRRQQRSQHGVSRFSHTMVAGSGARCTARG